MSSYQRPDTRSSWITVKGMRTVNLNNIRQYYPVPVSVSGCRCSQVPSILSHCLKLLGPDYICIRSSILHRARGIDECEPGYRCAYREDPSLKLLSACQLGIHLSIRSIYMQAKSSTDLSSFSSRTRLSRNRHLDHLRRVNFLIFIMWTVGQHDMPVRMDVLYILGKPVISGDFGTSLSKRWQKYQWIINDFVVWLQ